MDVRSIDMNLLTVFGAMLECRSVSRAADRIGLSQPAMSAALARLRVQFDDPLFVRSGTEMKPTPRAIALAPAVERVLQTVRLELLQPAQFEPALSTRAFSLLTPDIGEVRFVPPLLRALRLEAPSTTLRVMSRARAATAELLESGEAELAVGYFPDLDRAHYFQQKLFDNAHVCVVHASHPLAGGLRLSLPAYLDAAHAVVRPDGREHFFDRFMREQGLRRHVRLELSHFMSLLPILGSSDLLATVPTDIAQLFARYADVRLLTLPVNPPAVTIRQYWHERVHKDAANVWLRGLIHAQFSSLTRPHR
ncbi:LysR family transcriptional regulator [Pseudomonas gingeri]|uniref:LysR family transcriptional regulator n=1 Tax=Pseudomonas gingeri TaxID=117681 RepID=A0A7Y7XJ72_9PSED|nr:LysR family transcriptional regulator [Pseudomonas gingeri]NWB99807.1 LysR family transcriptional regulator [Pseudomonas gingeri]